jgi:hypothetical protein
VGIIAYRKGKGQAGASVNRWVPIAGSLWTILLILIGFPTR